LRRVTSLNVESLLLLTVALCGCAVPARSNDNGPGGNEDPDLARPPFTSLKDLSGVDLVSQAVPDLAGGSGSPDLKAPVADMATGGTASGNNGADLCANAPFLVAGTTYVDHDTTGYTDNYDFGANVSIACDVAFSGFGYDGPDGAYKFSIDPGKTLSVLLTKSNLPYNWDAALAIVTDCNSAGPTCLSGSDEVSGNTESVSYKNNGGSPLLVYILVDGFLPSEFGKYTIRADVN
jgi:hypothetical protein